MKRRFAATCMASVLFLSGCGGGGGGGDAAPPQPEPLTYPGAQAFANFVTNALSCPYVVSGSLSGMALTGAGMRTFGAAGSANFEGQTALSKLVTDVGQLAVDGVSGPYFDELTLFLTTNYQMLGIDEAGLHIVATSAAAPPPSVKVGDTGPLATMTVYADATKAVVLGRIEATYVIEADTETTALFNLRTLHYDAGGAYVETDNWRLRMQTSGAVQLHSVSGTDAVGDTVTFTCAMPV
jgi:hypothetical protein